MSLEGFLPSSEFSFGSSHYSLLSQKRLLKKDVICHVYSFCKLKNYKTLNYK